MDKQQSDEMSKQTVLDFNCKKILPTSEKSAALSPFVKKLGVVSDKNLEPNIACGTPEKTGEPLLNKSQQGQVKLPENYRIVAELFDHMNCSLRLLGLRKKSLTFENVSTQMEILTKRNFSYKHLAQIKYILPEALQIDKILIHDKKILSMKPDMKISILFDVVEGHSEVSNFVALSQLFSSRLFSFFTTHPEACDVPEAILPEPFNKRSPVVPDELHVNFHEISQPSSAETENSEKVGQNPCFKRHFSQNAVIEEKEKIGVSAPAVITSVSVLKQEGESEPREEIGDRFSVLSSVSCQDTKAVPPEDSQGTCSVSITQNPQSQPNYAHHSLNSGPAESPLPKPAPSNDTLAIETPSQPIPRRLVSSCDIITHKITSSHNSTQSCKPAKRSLDFFHSEGEESAFDLGGNELKYDPVVYRDISQITKGVSEDGHTPSSSLVLPEELGQPIGGLSEFCDLGQIGESTCPDISSCLAEHVDLIHSIFKSVNFAAITKEELVHKIIMNSLDVVEKKEVEDQLDLLESRVPDWICKKLVSSGDIVYNIKDESDLDLIRGKLTSF